MFPVRWVEDGICTCPRQRRCNSPGKHPLTGNGFNAATTDPSQIEAWWERWPKANIGLPTGDGLVVVDIDGPDGERQAAQLHLPATVEVKTGRGRHLYYQGDAGRHIGLLPGVDISGNGGYVVAPPSGHKSGAAYEWINSPEDTELAPLPASVTELIRSKTPRSARSAGPIERRPIVEGERNHELFRFACLLRSIGADADEIACAIEARNAECCDPPLDLDEIAAIAFNAAQHPGIYLSDAALLRTGIKPPGIALYLAIRARADHQGICIAGFDTLADEANIARTTAITWSRDLEANGLLRITRPGPLKRSEPVKANVYTLLDPGEQPTATARAEGTSEGEGTP